MWHPSCWSLYKLPNRTNNNMEGWHHSLNRRASFYLLKGLLHQEASLMIQIQLVSDGKLSHIQKRKYHLLQLKTCPFFLFKNTHSTSGLETSKFFFSLFSQRLKKHINANKPAKPAITTQFSSQKNLVMRLINHIKQFKLYELQHTRPQPFCIARFGLLQFQVLGARTTTAVR